MILELLHASFNIYLTTKLSPPKTEGDKIVCGHRLKLPFVSDKFNEPLRDFRSIFPKDSPLEATRQHKAFSDLGSLP
jgi:hypothetical protein